MNVDEYIEKQKSPQKEICQKLRQIILNSYPDILEEMKYGVPYYGDKYYIVALKTHVNLGFSKSWMIDPCLINSGLFNKRWCVDFNLFKSPMFTVLEIVMTQSGLILWMLSKADFTYFKSNFPLDRLGV